MVIGCLFTARAQWVLRHAELDSASRHRPWIKFRVTWFPALVSCRWPPVHRSRP